MNKQTGFTLIELVIVIVLLGVLAAIAVPRFVNLDDDAQRVTLQSTAAAITSAMNINYAGCAVNNHAVGPDCRPVANCTDAAAVINGGLAGYTVTPAAIGAGNGTTESCTITKIGYTPPPSADPVRFIAIRAGTP